MKKKWIVIAPLLVLALAGIAVTMPIWAYLWQMYVPQPKVAIDRGTSREAIDGLITQYNRHYVLPDKAKQVEAFLRQRQQEGIYDRVMDAEQLAQQLTDDVQHIAPDRHMMVGFSADPLPPDSKGGPRPETQADWERRNNFVMRQITYIMANPVDKVEHLDGNIGYLKISGFPPPFISGRRFAAAMDELAGTDGLIMDLRGHRGGNPEGVALLISYFVDQRTRLNDIWDRSTGTSQQHWSVDKLDGKRYGSKKPVLILVDPDTKSAGEEFVYTMQALKRATVIGAPTWGGAHPSRAFRIGKHFFAFIPNRRAINPITGSNWEGAGVIPDIAAAPDKALGVAEDLLRRRLEEGGALAAARQ